MTGTQASPIPRPVRSVKYALAALRLVSVANRPLGVTEIAQGIGMSPSSCYNVLKTLASERFLVFNPTTKKYTLGSGALELSNRTRDSQRVFNDNRPRILGLANDLGVVVGFWEIRDERLVLSGVVDSDAAIRIQMTPGQRLPLGSGAMGRAIAATLELRGQQLALHVEQARWHRSPNLTSYRREVKQATAQGWAVDKGQFIGGVTTVASVVAAGPRDPRYCLAASGFVGEVQSPKIERIGAETHRIASEIERDRFGRGPVSEEAHTFRS